MSLSGAEASKKWRLKNREKIKAYKQKNRDKINAWRRAHRQKKRQAELQNQYCLLCEISMAGNADRTWKYCRDCRNRFRDSIERHRKSRYNRNYKLKLKHAKMES
jgi:hypothetical protein